MEPVGVRSGNPTGVLFLDLKKAFDTVDHDILLYKLQSFGLAEDTIEWFRSYLGGRQQVTKVDGVLSDPLPVTCGVPQGSILGPLLFILYINDLHIYLQNSHVNLYADDTAISVSGTNLDVIKLKMQTELDEAGKWFNRNELTLNVSKTKIMFFGTHMSLQGTEKIEIKYNKEIVQHVDKYKYLGIMLDPRLTFSKHIEHMRAKTMYRIGVISRARKHISQAVAVMLYKSLVIPVYDYCDIIYDTLTLEDACALQRMQNCALRAILQEDSYASVHTMHNDLHIEWLRERRECHTAHFVYKCLNEMFPNIPIWYILVSKVSTRVTRSSERCDLYQLNAKLTKVRENIRHRGVGIWNRVPNYIRLDKSFKYFKFCCIQHRIFRREF